MKKYRWGGIFFLSVLFTTLILNHSACGQNGDWYPQHTFNQEVYGLIKFSARLYAFIGVLKKKCIGQFI